MKLCLILQCNLKLSIMKREILFRVYDLDSKEYLKGDFSIGVESSEIRGKYGEVFENLIIEQFTGLTDKNGVKIFENDIVRWDDMTNGERWRVAVVEFNPDIQFRIIRIGCDFIQSAKEGYIFKFGRFIYTDTHKHLEIIGNIHDA